MIYRVMAKLVDKNTIGVLFESTDEDKAASVLTVFKQLLKENPLALFSVKIPGIDSEAWQSRVTEFFWLADDIECSLLSHKH